MGRAYSADLHERVLRAHEAGEGSQRVLAARFGVATGTVSLWLAAAREEGRRGPRPHGGGRKALCGADPAVLAAPVAEGNDLPLAEYAARLAERSGVRPSIGSMGPLRGPSLRGIASSSDRCFADGSQER